MSILLMLMSRALSQALIMYTLGIDSMAFTDSLPGRHLEDHDRLL
jgi:hypothetical protein